ncbi:MAG: TetR/AcrR family transcriptional regulator, partial [Pseudomonadota bacterium]
MDRVASRAEVSKRTVYNHFESKEALFRAILDIMASECNAAFSISYKKHEPIEGQLRNLGWAEGKLLTSPDFMKLARMVTGETMRDPELAAEMNCKLERIA